VSYILKQLADAGIVDPEIVQMVAGLMLASAYNIQLQLAAEELVCMSDSELKLAIQQATGGR
jgi:hypothetical protein